MTEWHVRVRVFPHVFFLNLPNMGHWSRKGDTKKRRWYGEEVVPMRYGLLCLKGWETEGLGAFHTEQARLSVGLNERGEDHDRDGI